MAPKRSLSEAGFTLIELMVTVAILAIIAAIAIPIYTNFVLRGNVQNGVQGLALARTRMEQYYLDNRKYNSAGTTCGATMPTAADTPNFAVTCVAGATGTTYTVTATGSGTSMSNFVYTINETNLRTSTINKTGWGNGSTVQCWITRAGETC